MRLYRRRSGRGQPWVRGRDRGSDPSEQGSVAFLERLDRLARLFGELRRMNARTAQVHMTERVRAHTIDMDQLRSPERVEGFMPMWEVCEP